MNKKVVKLLQLLALLTLPAISYVFLATGEVNARLLPYFGPKQLAENGTDTIYHTIPAFSFVNQDGKTVTEDDYKDKVYVANYFFATCQTICPIMSTQLLRVQEKFKEKKQYVRILSHTVDPEHDSVAVLRDYANMVHADTEMWDFVTGDKKELYDIARHGYLLNALEGDGGPEDFIHSELFLLIDRDRHIRGIYDGTNIKKVNELNDDIKMLMREYYFKDKEKEKASNLH